MGKSDKSNEYPILAISDYSKTKPNVQSWTMPTTGAHAGIVQARITLKVSEKKKGWKRLGKFEWTYTAHNAFVQGEGDDKLEVWGHDDENYKIGGRYWDTKGLWIIVKVKAVYVKDGMTRNAVHVVKCYDFGKSIMRMKVLEVDSSGNPDGNEVTSIGAKAILDKVVIIEEYVRQCMGKVDSLQKDIDSHFKKVSDYIRRSDFMGLQMADKLAVLAEKESPKKEVSRFAGLFKKPITIDKIVTYLLLFLSTIGVLGIIGLI